jgi:integrase
MPKKQPNKNGRYKKSFCYVENGKEIRVASYGKTQAEADRKNYEKKRAYEEGRLTINSSTMFGRWAAEWLETYKRPNVDSNSYKRYERTIRLHLSLLADLPLKDIRPVHLQRTLNLQEGKSHSNTKKIYLTLRQIFKRAVINDLIAKDPTEGLTMPRTTTGERRPLTQDERNLFVSAAATHPRGAWVLTMLMCGLREGETVPLTWADVDIKRRSLTVNKAVSYEGNHARQKSTKTRSSNRTVPIPDILFDALMALPRRPDSALVFTPAIVPGMLTSNHIRKMWKSFMRHADIMAGAKTYRNKVIEHVVDQTISPHYLRHTYATDLYKMGVDLKTAQYLLGHADIRMTADIYTHADEEKALNILSTQNQYNESN